MEQVFKIDSSDICNLLDRSEDVRKEALFRLKDILNNNIIFKESSDCPTVVNLEILVRHLIQWFQFRPLTQEHEVLNLLTLIISQKELLNAVTHHIGISRLRKEFLKIGNLKLNENSRIKVQKIIELLNGYDTVIVPDMMQEQDSSQEKKSDSYTNCLIARNRKSNSTPPLNFTTTSNLPSKYVEDEEGFWIRLEGKNKDIFNAINNMLLHYRQSDSGRNIVDLFLKNTDEFPIEFYFQSPNVLTTIINLMNMSDDENTSINIVKFIRFIVNSIKSRWIESLKYADDQELNFLSVKNHFNQIMTMLTTYFETLQKNFNLDVFEKNLDILNEIYLLLFDVSFFISKTQNSCEIYFIQLINAIGNFAKLLRTYKTPLNRVDALKTIRIHLSLELVKLLTTSIKNCSKFYADNLMLKQIAQDVFLQLLSIEILEIRQHTYSFAKKSIQEKISDKPKDDPACEDSLCHIFGIPITTEIVAEIICFGLTDVDEEIRKCAKFIFVVLLRSKIIFSERYWLRIYDIMKPVLPLTTAVLKVHNYMDMLVNGYYQSSSPHDKRELNQALARFLFSKDPESRSAAKMNLLQNLRFEEDLIQVIPDDFCILPKHMDLDAPIESVIRKLTINILYKWAVCIASFRCYIASNASVLEFLIKTLIFLQDDDEVKKQASCLLFLLLFSDFVVTNGNSVSMPKCLSSLNCPFKFDQHWIESPFNVISEIEEVDIAIKATNETGDICRISQQLLRFSFANEWFKDPESLIHVNLSDFSTSEFYNKNLNENVLKVSETLRLTTDDIIFLKQSSNSEVIKEITFQLDNTKTVQEVQSLTTQIQTFLLIPSDSSDVLCARICESINRLLVYDDKNEAQKKMFLRLLQIYQQIMKWLKDEHVLGLLNKKFLIALIKTDLEFPEDIFIEGLNVIDCIVNLCEVRAPLKDAVIIKYDRQEKFNFPSRLVVKFTEKLFQDVMKDGKWHEVNRHGVAKAILRLIKSLLNVMKCSDLDDTFLCSLFGHLSSVTLSLRLSYQGDLNNNNITINSIPHTHASLLKLIFAIMLKISSIVKRLNMKPEHLDNLMFWTVEELDENLQNIKPLPWMIIEELTKDKESCEKFCSDVYARCGMTLPTVLFLSVHKPSTRRNRLEEKIKVLIIGNIVDHCDNFNDESSSSMKFSFNIEDDKTIVRKMKEKFLQIDNVSACCFMVRKIIAKNDEKSCDSIINNKLLQKFMNFEVPENVILEDYKEITDRLLTIAACYNWMPLMDHAVEVVGQSKLDFVLMMLNPNKYEHEVFKNFNQAALDVLLIMTQSKDGVQKIANACDNSEFVRCLMIVSHYNMNIENKPNVIISQMKFWYSFLVACSSYENSPLDIINKQTFNMFNNGIAEMDLDINTSKSTILEKSFSYIQNAIDFLFLQIVGMFELIYTSKFKSEEKLNMKCLCSMLISLLSKANEGIQRLVIKIDLVNVVINNLDLTLKIMQRCGYLETTKKHGVKAAKTLITDTAILFKALYEWQIPLDSHKKLISIMYGNIFHAFDWIENDSILFNCFINLSHTIGLLPFGRKCIMKAEVNDKSLISYLMKKAQDLSMKTPHTDANLTLLKNVLKLLLISSNWIEVRLLLRQAKVFHIFELLHPQIYSNKKTTWDSVIIEWLKFTERFSRYEDTECLTSHVSLICRLFRVGNQKVKLYSLIILRNLSLITSIGNVLLNSKEFTETVTYIIQNDSIASNDEKIIVLQTLLSISTQSYQMKAKIKNSSLYRILKDEINVMQSNIDDEIFLNLRFNIHKLLISMDSRQNDLINRLNGLKKYQEEQESIIKTKQLDQRALLTREQLQMYEMLGLSVSSYAELTSEQTNVGTHSDNDFEDITHMNQEEEESDSSDESYIKTYNNELVTKDTMASPTEHVLENENEENESQVPKRPFLRRGSGLTARFRIPPDAFNLKNLPRYKYADRIKKNLSKTAQKSKKSKIPPQQQKKSIEAVKSLSEPKNDVNHQPDTKLIDLEQKQPQQEVLKLDTPTTVGLKKSPETSSSHDEPEPKIQDWYESRAKERNQNVVEKTKVNEVPNGFSWGKILNMNNPIDSSLQSELQNFDLDLNDTSLFHLLEQKINSLSKDPSLSTLTKLMSVLHNQVNGDDDESNKETFANPEDPLVTNKASVNVHLVPHPSDVNKKIIVDDDEDDTSEEEVEQDQHHVRFSDNVEVLDDATDLSTDLEAIELSQTSTPNQPEQFLNFRRNLIQHPNANKAQEKEFLKKKSGELKEKLEELEFEINSLRKQNENVTKIRNDLALDKLQLQHDREDMIERMKDDRIKMELQLHDERLKLEQDKQKHEKMLKNPTKKEREEITKLKETVEELKEEIKSKDSRHGSTSARYRSQIKLLEKENQSLKLELDVVKKENKKLELENARLRKDTNHKMLQEINKNIAKLAPQPQENKKQSEVVRKTTSTRKNETAIKKRPPKVQPKSSETTESSSDDDEISSQKSLKENNLINENVRRSNPVKNPSPSSSEILADMKREIVNSNGSKDIWYPNGNLKKISPDGMLIRMLYFNKDIKETNIYEGTVKYYYNETNTWHTTYIDGLEILEYPDGQIEHRHKDGMIEIHYSNGSICVTNSNWTDDTKEEWKLPDGTNIKILKNESKILMFPNGQREIHTANHKRREYPDGTVKLLYEDGSCETRYSNGRIRIKDNKGNLISDTMSN
ncbi:CLUMA_CG012825, isoform A [Clunio marinus]|uniref:CLUMA_CG012825, isoform A n=1 Tax=Clunio marinus TaxID=568069 RepID=A0A1J1IIC0_9DIPT|nr:CLUMA_CG012825, isoform A [Clunio marinus]